MKEKSRPQVLFDEIHGTSKMKNKFVRGPGHIFNPTPQNAEEALKEKLFKLAAEMAMFKEMPSPYVEDYNFPSGVSRKTIMLIIDPARKAERQFKDWSIRLRKIIDGL